MSTGTNEQMITGGELVAKALKAEGIEVIYTLCGGHIIDIYNGCLNEGIKIIDVSSAYNFFIKWWIKLKAYNLIDKINFFS